MSDQGPTRPAYEPPVPPPYSAAAQQPQAPTAPPVETAPGGYVPPRYEPNQPPMARPRRRGPWMWFWLGLGVLFVVGAIGMCVWMASLFGEGDGIPVGNAIAVIPLDGTIAGSGSYIDGVITPQEFLDTLERAEDDSRVKAIVLRVDSPGGTVAASEEIASYIKAAKKPVVVSVGDICASGAYMVSSQADKIVAMPGSAVGSIGVISEIPNVAGLLDKVGVEFKVITAGKYKDTGSPYRAMTPTETAMIQGDVDEVYGQFIDIVAEGRKMQRSKVESMATGWAWNGEQAKKLGLVDQIGSYDDARETAAKLGGIKGDFDTVTYEQQRIGGLLNALLGIESSLHSLSEAATPSEATQRRTTLPK